MHGLYEAAEVGEFESVLDVTRRWLRDEPVVPVYPRSLNSAWVDGMPG